MAHHPVQVAHENYLKLIIRRIDAFIFPHLCVICDAPRADGERWFCTDCTKEILDAISSRLPCPRCGLNTAMRSCTCEFAWDFPFDRIISFVDYSEKIQTIMHFIKYHGKRDLARYIGRFCTLHAKTALPFDLVVPLPLHWLRQKKRGYNQAEWFARGLFDGTTTAQIVPDLLKRKRATKTQTSLDKEERLKNVANAFTLAPGAQAALSGKKVLLVDDVITTGATTAAASRILFDGGCASVTVLSFARD